MTERTDGAIPPPESQTPRVSVIVPAYGVAHLLGDALRSLQAQTLREWEAIVIDDGAPDDVVGAFTPFAADRRFRLVLTDNRGLAAARNRAIAASRAPVICLLDGDDLYEPAYLERMLEAIDADQGVGFVCCDAMVFGDGEPTPRRYSELYPMHGRITLDRVIDRSFVIVVAAMFRRSAMGQIGGFDERLPACEDLDAWIRLLSAGWRGAHVAEPLARYRRRRGSMSSSARRMFESNCAVYRKASVALEGRAEQAVANRMLESSERILRWLDGEERILRGDVAGGLMQLSDAQGRSRRWRIGLAVMRRAPGTAAALLKMRTWLPGRLPRTPGGAAARAQS